jgi:hypothetical protein
MQWERERDRNDREPRAGAVRGFPVTGQALSDYAPARTTAGEQVLIRYTRGRGRFSPDKRYIALSMTMYTPDGRPDGHHEGVWEAQFRDPSQLLWRPDPPTGQMNQPVGPVERLTPSAETKAVWVFGDQSSVTAIGAAMSHLVPLEDGSFLFMVSCAQTITGGTGRFEGVSGLKTSMGSTYVPRGVDLFGPGDVQFEATTVDTFRLLRPGGMSPGASRSAEMAATYIPPARVVPGGEPSASALARPEPS